MSSAPPTSAPTTAPTSADTPSAAPPPEPPPAAPPADSLQRRITDLESQLAHTRDSLARAERRREIDRLLVESHATDIEAAAAIVLERTATTPTPDLADEIRTLKRRKPALFKRTTAPSSMGGREADPPHSPADSAHREAATGSRAALLRYMRARRS